MVRKQIPLRLDEQSENALVYIREHSVPPTTKPGDMPAKNSVISASLQIVERLIRDGKLKTGWMSMFDRGPSREKVYKRY